MAQSRIRLGIIGANPTMGWAPRAHLPALRYLPEWEVAAVCTTRAETAQATASEYGVPLAFDDYHDLLKRDDIDAVSIVVRVPLHHEIAMDALKAGKHVYTEWPLGATLAEAEEMAGLAQDKGLHTMVGLQGRQSPTFLRIKELLDEGYVGEVLSCHLSQFRGGVLERTSDRTWQSDRALGTTTFTIAFGHALDCFRMCVGDFAEVNGVVATQVPEWKETDTGRTVEVTAPDHVLASGKLTNGAVASVQVMVVPWHADGLNKIEVFGREGTLVATMDGIAQIDKIELSAGKGTEGAMSTVDIPERLSYVPEGVPEGPAFNIARLYQRFAEAIHTGERREPDFDTAVGLHRVLDSIQRSSDSGSRQLVGG